MIDIKVGNGCDYFDGTIRNLLRLISDDGTTAVEEPDDESVDEPAVSKRWRAVFVWRREYRNAGKDWNS